MGSNKFEGLVSPSFFTLRTSNTQIIEIKWRSRFQPKNYIRKRQHSQHLYNKLDNILTFLICKNWSLRKLIAYLWDTEHSFQRWEKYYPFLMSSGPHGVKCFSRVTEHPMLYLNNWNDYWNMIENHCRDSIKTLPQKH